MQELDLQQIVEAVTAEVLAAMRCSACAAPDDADGKKRLLVIGEMAKVPAPLCVQATLFDLSAYEADRNILRYDQVVITELTTLQLADIALGRPADAADCAVLQALLNGKEVCMLERALPHRIYAGKGSTRLYSLYEDYVRTLQSFGVKTLTAERLYRPEVPAAKPAKYQAEAVAVPRGSAQPNHGLVITETAAQALVETADGAVHIPCRAIVTPAAADVFKKAQVAVEKDL